MFNFGLSPTEAELALMEFERRKREEWEKKHPVQAYIERRKAKKAYEKMCKRANAELCLLGVRGKPKRMDAGVHSVIMSHIEEHSKKPAETRDRIVKLMAGGGLPKIELFARQSIDGWDCWGNEV